MAKSEVPNWGVTQAFNDIKKLSGVSQKHNYGSTLVDTTYQDSKNQHTSLLHMSVADVYELVKNVNIPTISQVYHGAKKLFPEAAVAASLLTSGVAGAGAEDHTDNGTSNSSLVDDYKITGFGGNSTPADVGVSNVSNYSDPVKGVRKANRTVESNGSDNASNVDSSAVPPMPGDLFDIYGLINGTEWDKDVDISEANISCVYYNSSTGAVLAEMNAKHDGSSYLVPGINKSVIPENKSYAQVWIDGLLGKINGTNNWTVMYPTDGDKSVNLPITYVSPTPSITDFTISLFKMDSDYNKNDVRVIANRSNHQNPNTNSTLLIDGKVFAKNNTFSRIIIDEVYKNMSVGTHEILLIIESPFGKKSTITRNVTVAEVPPVNPPVNGGSGGGSNTQSSGPAGSGFNSTEPKDNVKCTVTAQVNIGTRNSLDGNSSRTDMSSSCGNKIPFYLRFMPIKPIDTVMYVESLHNNSQNVDSAVTLSANESVGDIYRSILDDSIYNQHLIFNFADITTTHTNSTKYAVVLPEGITVDDFSSSAMSYNMKTDNFTNVDSEILFDKKLKKFVVEVDVPIESGANYVTLGIHSNKPSDESVSVDLSKTVRPIEPITSSSPVSAGDENSSKESSGVGVFGSLLMTAGAYILGRKENN